MPNRNLGRWIVAVMASITLHVSAQGIAQGNILRLPGMDQKEAIKVNDHIYQAVGFSNTYLVLTKEGNVLIDTSTGLFVPKHQQMLRQVSTAPLQYIIVTHAHPDHVGGIRRWRSKETRVIAHARFQELRDYHTRLRGLFERRNSAQYGIGRALVRAAAAETARPEYAADITFEKTHTFKLGELTFEIHSTPGETQDQISVWIPELKVAFIGDNMYETFPNMYTLRGTEFRSPLPWIASLELVRSWKPEIILGSHVLPIVGAAECEKKLNHYIESIRFVHDKTVEGMNQGKDVWTLMQEIKLPEHLRIGEQYGRLTWSIRGIYEGYVGFFDERIVSMYAVPPSAVHDDLVQLVGGPGPILARAETLASDHPQEALHLLEIVLNADPSQSRAREIRIQCYRRLLEQAENVIEQGWLRDGILQEETALKKAPSSPSATP
jgi:alkyl sulfatase BDS1-like metallo-beta-lactamase superfamily hydrolase